MKVSMIRVGELIENCYLIEKDNNYLLIDPGDDYNAICEFIKDKCIIGILITHSHHDHVASLSKLVHEFNYKVYDYNNLVEGSIAIDGFKIEVIFTPGHTHDSVTYYFPDDKVMFTGDFLFKGTIGRCDFYDSDYDDMLGSLDKLKKYDKDIIIYPGHGDSTVLRDEFINNPFMR